MSVPRSRSLFVLTLLCWMHPATGFCQEPVDRGGTIQFNLENEVKLETLVEYVSKRLDVRFLYSTDLSNKLITIQAPANIELKNLPVLLSSILRAEGLAIVESEVPGFKRIIELKDIAKYAPTGNATSAFAQNGPSAPVTQTFQLKHVAADSIASIVKSILSINQSNPGPNIISLTDNNTLVITDYAANLRTVENLIALIDRPGGETTSQIYNVKHQQSGVLAEQVTSILEAQKSKSPIADIALFDEARGNQIVVAGSTPLVKQAIALLEQLDISLGLRTEVYRMQNVTAERIDKIIRGYIAPKDADRVYQSTLDEEGNMLIVRASDAIHEQIEDVLKEMDEPVTAGDSPIQFYKLRNANALDVLYSLLALQEAYGTGGGVSAQNGILQTGFTPFGSASFSPTGTTAFPGLNRTNSPLQQRLQGTQTSGFNQGTNQGLTTTQLPLPPGNTGAGGNSFLQQATNPLASALGGGFGGQGGLSQVATLPGGARVSADVGTNSIIVVAPPNVQPMYDRLIKSLDRRRPQVMIEAKIVAVDTTDNFGLGVEVSVGDRTGDRRLFKFTSFGLSEVNPDTGALRIIPQLGFNGAIVDPEVADVVVNAVASHSRGTVLAAPKILVNDNSTGKLESVVSVPFQSVNASETVSTTSLGGDQQAGTIITVTPHINEDNHLQLEFDVEFSTFTATAVGNLPPPRQIERVGSVVTIPDGKTVVVGGLRRIGESHNFEGVPWAEKIPIVRELTSETRETLSTTSFFLFIRPKVLRDSRFQDLRFLSDRESSQAGLPGDFPISGPVLIP